MDHELYLYDEIGGFGIGAAAFIAQLAAIPAGDRITVRINSPGGSITEGMAIFNALARRRNVTTEIDGLAASIASVIALAGSPVRMAEGAMFMIHNASLGMEGDPDELRKGADTLEKFQDIITAVYARKTGIDSAKLGQWMSSETWLTAEEALAAGFVDEVVAPLAMAAKAKPGWLAKFKHAPMNLTAPTPIMAETDTTPAVTPEPEPETITILPDAEPAKEAEPAAKTEEPAAIEADVVNAVEAKLGELSALTNRLTEMSAQFVALTVERDAMKARAEFAEAAKTRTETLFNQLKSSLGLNPAARMPALAPMAQAPAEIAAQIEATKDPNERARLISKNKAALREAGFSRVN